MIDESTALQLARDAYSGSTMYFDANIRPDLEKDLRQFHSKHNPDSKYMSEGYRGRARFYRPKTRAMVRGAEASVAEALFSTSDVVSITPEDSSNDIQQASAEVVQELLQYRMTKSVPWFQVAVGAFQDAEVQGVVISHQDWHREKDVPVITLIPRENFRYDPAADWTDPINSSPYLIWLMPMYVKDVKARMASGKWMALSDQEILSAAKKYSDTTRMLREGNRTDSSDQITAINDFTIVWVHMNVMEIDGSDELFFTLGTEHLLAPAVPLSARYAHGKRPFVLGKVVIETHKTDPAGEVRLTRDVAAEINEIANQRIDNVKFAMNKRYFVKRNKQVDIRSLTRNTIGSVTLMGDPELDVKVVDTPDVTSSAYQEQDRLNMDFDEISGNMSQSSVQANRRLNETVGGMEILSADANKVKAYAIKIFIETWVEPVMRQMILLEQRYETDAVILALAANKSKMFQKLGMDAVTDELLMQELTLTVNVGMNATSPTQKINNLLTGINGVKNSLADGVLERYGVDPTEVIKEVFGALGHKDGGRFFKFEGEQDPRIMALEQEKQQLQAALDAKYPPELLAAQVREIDSRIGKTDADKVAKMVEAIYSSMQAGEVLATVPQVAPIADKIMQAGGYQQPAPAGIDPNFPQPAAPVTPAAVDAAMTGPIDVPESGNTSPAFPARPGSPGVGANEGMEADGVQGFAEGGEVRAPRNDMQTRQSTNTPPQAGAMGRIADRLNSGLDAVVDHPAYNVAQAVPGINIPLSAAAYSSHMRRDMPVQAALDAVSAIPGARAAQMIPKVVPNLSRGSLTANAMRVGTLAQGAQLGQSAEAFADQMQQAQGLPGKPQGFSNGGAVHPHNAAFYDPPLDPNSPQQQSFAMVRDEDRDER